MNEETQMVLLDYREYMRLKANSDKYLRHKEGTTDCCTSCKDSHKKTLKIDPSSTNEGFGVKNNSSITKEGFGEIKVPEELPSKFIDKPNIYDGATPEQLQEEAGTTSSKSTAANRTAKTESDENIDRSSDSDQSTLPWYYIGH